MTSSDVVLRPFRGCLSMSQNVHVLHMSLHLFLFIRFYHGLSSKNALIIMAYHVFFIVLNLIQFGCPQSATEISNSPSPPACPSLVGHWVPRHSWKDRKIRRCSTSFQLIYVIFPYVLMMFSIKTSNFHAFLLGATAMIFRHPASWQCSLVLRSQSRCTRRAKGASAGIWSGMYGVILGNITHGLDPWCWYIC